MDATDQQHELRQILRRGAKDYGFAANGWTLARIRRVIHERFSVAYADLSGVWRLLHRMGWTNQPPAAPWSAMSRPSPSGSSAPGPRSQKRGPRRGVICFGDESGTSLAGAVERTWAPAGQAPVLHVVKGAQSKLSVAVLCCYRPGTEPRMLYRSRPGWYRDRELIALLDQAHQELAAPSILVWDNLSGHRSRRMRRATAARAWSEVEYLPAYAPELDPAEGCGRTCAPLPWPIWRLCPLASWPLRCGAGSGGSSAARTWWLLSSLTPVSSSETNNQTSIRSKVRSITSGRWRA